MQLFRTKITDVFFNATSIDLFPNNAAQICKNSSTREQIIDSSTIVYVVAHITGFSGTELAHLKSAVYSSTELCTSGKKKKNNQKFEVFTVSEQIHTV
jgi:hypothetical protein